MKTSIFRISCLVLYSALFFGLGNRIQAQKELSLNGAIVKTLESNYQIRIASNQLEISKNNNSWGNAGLYPSLNFSLVNVNSFDKSPDQTTGEKSTTKLNTLNPSVSSNMVLFNGFRIQATKENFGKLQELSEGNEAIIIENTIQSLILAYYNCKLQEEKLEILEKLLSLSADRYDYLVMKKELGAALSYDVLQAKSAYLSDSSVYLLQALNVRNAQMNLDLIMGEEPGQNYILTDSLPVYLEEYQYADLLSKMKSDNNTLENQYINEEILKLSTKMAKSQLYPMLSLLAGYDLNQNWMKIDDYDRFDAQGFDYYANFTLSFNLFNGGNTRRQIQNARIQEQISDLQTNEMINKLSIVLAQVYDYYNVRRQLLLVADENLKAADLNLEISTEKYRQGSINSFNYRDVQNIYLNAAFSRLEALYNLIDSRTELLRLTGGIVSEYQP